MVQENSHALFKNLLYEIRNICVDCNILQRLHDTLYFTVEIIRIVWYKKWKKTSRTCIF